MKWCKKIAVVSVFMAILAAANAQPQTICHVSLIELMTCQSAAAPPSPPPPSAACCSTLSHADLKCLCSYKDSKVLPSLGIDPELAMKLPEKCKIPNPPKC